VLFCVHATTPWPGQGGYSYSNVYWSPDGVGGTGIDTYTSQLPFQTSKRYSVNLALGSHFLIV